MDWEVGVEVYHLLWQFFYTAGIELKYGSKRSLSVGVIFDLVPIY